MSREQDDERWFLRNAVLARAGELARGKSLNSGCRRLHMKAVDTLASHYENRLVELLGLSLEFSQGAIDAQRTLDEAKVMAAEGSALWLRMERLAERPRQLPPDDVQLPEVDPMHTRAREVITRLGLDGSRLDLAVAVFGWGSDEANGSLLGLVRSAWDWRVDLDSLHEALVVALEAKP